MSLSPLQSAWLDALVASRDILGRENVQLLWRETHHEVRTIATLCIMQPVRTWISPIIPQLTGIEQREVMLYLLAAQTQERGLGGKWTGFHDLCRQLGCLPDGGSIISERWRKLQMLRDLRELPYAALEDRPICKICSGRVATGAGWRPEQTGGNAAVHGDYRPDVHHECKRYALNILLPRLRIMQAQAAAKVTAEVDK